MSPMGVCAQDFVRGCEALQSQLEWAKVASSFLLPPFLLPPVLLPPVLLPPSSWGVPPGTGRGYPRLPKLYILLGRQNFTSCEVQFETYILWATTKLYILNFTPELYILWATSTLHPVLYILELYILWATKTLHPELYILKLYILTAI